MSFQKKCTHDENRMKVCGPCGNKIVFGKIDPKKFLINPRTEKLINDHIDKDFNVADEIYPLSICRTCYLTLLEAEKDIFKRPLQTMPDYKKIVLPKRTRLMEDICNCYICSTGRSNSHIKTVKGKGKKRNLNNVIDVSKELNGSTIENASNSKDTHPTDVIRLCNKCYQEIKRGKEHLCRDPTKNIIKIIEQLPDKKQEQIASTVIRNKVDSIKKGTSKKINIDLTLSNFKGRNTAIKLNPDVKKDVFFSEEGLDNFRVNSGASANQMVKITNFIRSNVGRLSVPVNYRKHMSEKSKILKNIYKSDVYEFECENSSLKQQRPVVYADAEELLDAIIENRNLQGNFVVKAMADGGQGFFKISLTILPENHSPQLHTDNDPSQFIDVENSESDQEEFDKISTNKRSLYCNGGSISKKRKLSSVYKLILLCVVPQIKESYDNIKLLFDLTKINHIPFKFVADFKLLLMINGQQTATASFPCPYCLISLNEMRSHLKLDNDSSIEAAASSSQNIETKSNSRSLKTYGDLRLDYDKFVLAGKNKKFSNQCHSTINPPLFDEKDDVSVLQKCIIPELHILQGFVNHLFWRGLVPLLGREKALLWPMQLHLVAKNYQGEAFEGNACRKLLKEADKLNNPQLYEDIGVFKIMPYVGAFKAMNKIVECCFTSGKVGDDLSKHVTELCTALKSIDDLSETLKIHVILSHVEESLQFIEKNNGLGYWSEQSGESVHREFLKFWGRYKMNNIHDKLYSSKLLTAVIEFSSLHI